ncbi:MAG: hypothetical protein ACNYVW_07805 [Methanosarcinales archaeon]
MRDGDTVLIVDDVITTGATKAEAWSKLTVVRKMKPKGILVAVDREELGDADKELLEATNLRMYSILKRYFTPLQIELFQSAETVA